MSVVILIPAYEPGAALVDLVRELRARPADRLDGVVVVDDGSGAEYSAVFAAVAALGAEVVAADGPVDGTPGRNRGKGFALRAGLARIRRDRPDAVVVTADCDGQHTPHDIARVAARTRELTDERALVLGGRRFVGAVPARSRLGNAVSRGLFRLATGTTVHDTQTGLRGLTPSAVEWALDVPGDRFDYELAQLIGAGSAGVRLDEIEIATVYLEQNASSHFRPVVDSVRVLRPLLAYVGVSFGSFLVDIVALQLLVALTGSLLVSVVGARLVSATVNFVGNRSVVFGDEGSRMRAALRYAALALALLLANYLLLVALSGFGVPLVVAKIVTESLLYLVGYGVQRRFVFRAPASVGPVAPVGTISPVVPIAPGVPDTELHTRSTPSPAAVS